MGQCNGKMPAAADEEPENGTKERGPVVNGEVEEKAAQEAGTSAEAAESAGPKHEVPEASESQGAEEKEDGGSGGEEEKAGGSDQEDEDGSSGNQEEKDGSGGAELKKATLTRKPTMRSRSSLMRSRTINNASFMDMDDEKEETAEEKHLKDEQRARRRPSVELGPTRSMSRNNLAVAAQQQGDSRGAYKILEFAMHDEEQKVGEEDFSLVTMLENLGILACELREPVSAIKHLKRALRIRKKHQGNIHDKVADCEFLLGDAYLQAGRKLDAEREWASCIKNRMLLHGEKDSKVASAVYHVAFLYEILGRFDDGRRAYAYAAWLFEKIEGPACPFIAWCEQGIKDTSEKLASGSGSRYMSRTSSVLQSARNLFNFNSSGSLGSPASSRSGSGSNLASPAAAAAGQ